MAHQLDVSIVRIYIDGTGNPAGLGFVISDQLVATCAHVVKRAKGFTESPIEKSEVTLEVDFPLIAPGQMVKAYLYEWQPLQSDGSGDIAILELNKGDFPDKVKAATITWGADLWGHPCRTFGFPFPKLSGPNELKNYQYGVWASGRILDRVDTGWYQIEDVKDTGYFVQQGFSGSPIWDDNLEAVVGLVGFVEKTQDRVAFFLPIYSLIQAFPYLINKVNSVSPLKYKPPKGLGTVLTGRSNISLWIQWVFASTLGWNLGIFIVLISNGFFRSFFWFCCEWPVIIGLQWLALRRSVYHAGRWALMSTTLLLLIGAFGLNLQLALLLSTFGLAIGAAQWLVLRRFYPRTNWWAFATSLGWIAGLISLRVGRSLWTLTGDVLGEWNIENINLILIVLIVGGITASIAQWYILRRHITMAFWWIFANAACWLIIALFIYFVSSPTLDLYSTLQASGNSLPPDQLWTALFPVGLICIIGVANAGTLLGAITGILLVWLPGQPVSKDIEKVKVDIRKEGS